VSEVQIGTALAEARRAAGLSIGVVAEQTRIRASLLTAIEEGSFSQCGGTVYAKGHIRSIAHVLGIDPEPLVADLATGSGEVPPQISLIASSPLGAPDALLRGGMRRRPPWTAVGMSAAGVVAILAVASYLAGQGGGSAPSPAKAPSIIPSAVAATTTAAPPSGARPSPATTSPTPDGVNVTVQITGDSSWVGMYDQGSNRLAFQGVLAAGTSKVFTSAQSVHLTIGKPEAVKVLVNGRSLGSPGTAGKPADVTYTQSGETTAPAG
jgi:cytoskeleton protein RodZ